MLGADVDDMGAIRMLAANDLRRRRGSTVAITLLIGIVGAVVIAAVAGARRSDTALSRFNDESRQWLDPTRFKCRHHHALRLELTRRSG